MYFNLLLDLTGEKKKKKTTIVNNTLVDEK